MNNRQVNLDKILKEMTIILNKGYLTFSFEDLQKGGPASIRDYIAKSCELHANIKSLHKYMSENEAILLAKELREGIHDQQIALWLGLV